jgi:hypothetical protein
MKKLATVSLALLIASALAGSVVASEKTVTLEGKMVCAKCNLKEEGLEKCQNVLVVESDAKKKHYYLTKNEVNNEFGDVCTAEKQVRVTGSVSEKDGKMWIAASEIVPVKSEG